MRISSLLVMLSLALCACGTADPGSADQGAQLIAQDYSLMPGQEIYLCKRVTLTADWLIRSITPSSAMGTHHQVLGIDPTKTSPDGSGPCGSNVEFQVTNWQMIYASGVNSPRLTMPDGVALVLHAGDQIVLQMHLLNASPQMVTGTAALTVTTWPTDALVTPAQMLLAGVVPDARFSPDIPQGPDQVVTGDCTLTADTQYFALFPHMHQVGSHIQVSTTRGGMTSTIYDHDYQFAEQVFSQFQPIAMAKGDRINVACTYDNETGKPVQFGQSSYQEMCFAISFVSPPLPAMPFGALCFM